MSLVENLQWRYATKKMNGEKISQEDLEYILDAAWLAPSSSGLQPYEIFIVENQGTKEQLRKVGFDQSQITDASHVLVFASWEDYTLEKIEKVFNHTTSERGIPKEAMDEYKDRLWSMYEPLGKEWRANHAARQAYISFGLAIAAAAEKKVDATPMEGFINSEVDKILGLEEKGLKSQIILTLGYRDAENDWLHGLKKVRTPKEVFFHTL